MGTSGFKEGIKYIITQGSLLVDPHLMVLVTERLPPLCDEVLARGESTLAEVGTWPRQARQGSEREPRTNMNKGRERVCVCYGLIQGSECCVYYNIYLTYVLT